MAEYLARKEWPPGTLGQYIGIGMAAMMLGRGPEQTGIVYDIINGNNLPIYKIGGVSLLRFADFAAAATDTYGDTCPVWPEELAKLSMEYIYSRSELAELLDMSIGSVHRLARDSDEVTALDLSEWNMHSLYYYVGNGAERLPTVVHIGGRKVKLTVDEDNELHIHVHTDDLLKSECFSLEPTKAWFVTPEDRVVKIYIEVHGENISE